MIIAGAPDWFFRCAGYLFIPFDEMKKPQTLCQWHWDASK